MIRAFIRRLLDRLFDSETLRIHQGEPGRPDRP